MSSNPFLLKSLLIFNSGPLTSEMAKSIGGVTFSKNHYGAFARQKVKGIDPHTALQMNQRCYMKYVLNQWSAISIAQRAAWEAFAKLYSFQNSIGNAYYLDGQSMFNKLNLTLYLINQPLIEDAPTSSSIIVPLPYLWSVDCNATPGNEEITVTFTPIIPATDKIAIYSSGSVPAGKSKNIKYKLLCVKDTTFLTAGSIKTDYLKVFGNTPKVNDHVWFKLRDISTLTGWSGADQITLSVAHI